jgi:hypothetical protein
MAIPVDENPTRMLFRLRFPSPTHSALIPMNKIKYSRRPKILFNVPACYGSSNSSKMRLSLTTETKKTRLFALATESSFLFSRASARVVLQC